jgi:hypothetical protein
MLRHTLSANSFVLATLLAQTPEAAKEIAWQTDFAAARAQAGKTGAPLFVAFRCER